MSSAATKGWIFVLVVCLPGCVLTPLGNYHTPEPLGKGNYRIGVAATAAPVFAMDMKESHEGPVVGGADLWLDYSFRENRDVRTRLTFLTGLYEPGQFDQIDFGIGLSFEHKSTKRSGSAAFLAGASVVLFFDLDSAEHPLPLITPFIGGIFGVGDPGGTRLILTPRLTGGIFPFAGIQVGFSVGLDLPTDSGISVRPEIGVNLGALYLWGLNEDEWVFPVWGGFGIAMLF